MRIARLLHAAAIVGFVGFGLLVPLGLCWQAGVVAAAGLLVWQHRLLRPDDLSRIHMAFFTANGIIAVLLFAAGGLDLWVFGAGPFR